MIIDNKTETEVKSKTHLQLLIITLGAVKDSEMKMIEIITLKLHLYIFGLLVAEHQAVNTMLTYHITYRIKLLMLKIPANSCLYKLTADMEQQ